jgi:hypothetical protein
MRYLLVIVILVISTKVYSQKLTKEERKAILEAKKNGTYDEDKEKSELKSYMFQFEDGIITYSEVVKVDSVGANELYSRAKKWIAKSYNSANDVIQYDDKSSGEIMVNGRFKIHYYRREPSISHLLTVQVKEGRYRYIISQLNYRDKQGDNFRLENFPKGWYGEKRLYDVVDSKIKAIINSLKEAMQESDDW